MTNIDPIDAPTVRILVTTTDDKGRKHTDRIPFVAVDDVPAARQAIRDRMPQGSVYTIKVIDNP